jgi:hypothetical protein
MSGLELIAPAQDAGGTTSHRQGRVEFVAVDNPHRNKLTIHILAAIAEHERKLSQSVPS